MTELRFDGRVALITGAGGGLGRAYARLLAARGAAVVVNDLGSALDGCGSSSTPAQAVVDEIEASGGIATTSTASVTDPAEARSMVDTALQHFGRIDIVVNNAGILRDKSFPAMTPEMVRAVIDVHLIGAFNVTAAAWPHMVEQGSGRVIFASSGAGLFGNFGQANYGAAKMGLVGLAHVLAVEGERHGIRVNAIAPVARTRMTENVLGRLVDRVHPDLVAPLVAWLGHDECEVTGHIYTVGGGRIARVFIGVTQGWARTDGKLTIEDVRGHFSEIEDPAGSTIPTGIADDFRALREALRGQPSEPRPPQLPAGGCVR